MSDTTELEKLFKRIVRAQNDLNEYKKPEEFGDPVQRQKKYERQREYLNQLRAQMIQLLCSGITAPIGRVATFPTQLSL